MTERADARSRFTFRPIVAGEAAWQRQLRDRYGDEPAPPVDLDLSKAVIRPIARAMASQVILRYEWLGTLPAVRRYFGLFFGPYLAGVTAVAIGNGTAGGNTAAQYGIASVELATLVRGACVHWAPPGANSKLVSWTTRLIARTREAKVILAYADTEAGEIGTIYQACGWTYIGPGSSVSEWLSPSGAIRNKIYLTRWRQKATTTETRVALVAAGWREQKSNPKLRYVLVLDKDDAKLVARVNAMRVPYPKREATPATSSGEGESDDAPVVQTGEDASRRSRRSKT